MKSRPILIDRRVTGRRGHTDVHPEHGEADSVRILREAQKSLDLRLEPAPPRTANPDHAALLDLERDRLLDEQTFTRWEETHERLGDCYADALAFAAADRLAVYLGPEKLNALLGKLFARPKDDVRVLLETPPAELLARAGMPWAELARRTAQLQASERARNAEPLARIPERSARVVVSRSPERGTKVEVEVTGEAQYRVIYGALGPWARTPATLARLDVRGAQDAPVVRATVPVSQARGTRLFVAIEHDERTLTCPIRLHAERLVLP